MQSASSIINFNINTVNDSQICVLKFTIRNGSGQIVKQWQESYDVTGPDAQGKCDAKRISRMMELEKALDR